MKKLLSLLMLLIFAGVGNVWAQTETTWWWTFTSTMRMGSCSHFN